MSKTSNSYCECGKQIKNSSITCEKCFHLKERKVKNRPSKEELLILLKSFPILTIGKQYNVSDNAVRKWAKQYGLPFKKKDIKDLCACGGIADTQQTKNLSEETP